jgi:hypothetical protein
MSNFDGCQLPCVPRFSLGPASPLRQSFISRVKTSLAVPWNYYVKKWLKQAYRISLQARDPSPAQLAAERFSPVEPLKDGDLVRVRSREEILSTLNPFKELKGCAFLPEMADYCESQQRVLRAMQFFLDERDYKLKKVRGVVLLENVICNGTPTFGKCDRCCFLFWREEWLEKVQG